MDWPTAILLGQLVPIGFLDEVMGTYRVRPGGVFSCKPRAFQLQECVRFLDPPGRFHQASIQQGVSRLPRSIARAADHTVVEDWGPAEQQSTFFG